MIDIDIVKRPHLSQAITIFPVKAAFENFLFKFYLKYTIYSLYGVQFYQRFIR